MRIDVKGLFSALTLWASLAVAAPSLAEPERDRAAQSVLHLVTESWPPYAYECDDHPCGLDVEVAIQVLNKLGYQPQIQFVPWPRALLLVQSGNADAILDISRGERGEREHDLLFPREPLTTSYSAFFYRQADAFTYSGLASLQGKRVALVRGYNYSADFMAATSSARELGANHEQNMKKLARGRVDLALMDTAVGFYLRRSLGLEQEIAVDPSRFVSGELYLAFARKPQWQSLSVAFEQALLEYKRSAAYQQLLQRYGLPAGPQ